MLPFQAKRPQKKKKKQTTDTKKGVLAINQKKHDLTFPNFYISPELFEA